MNVMWTARLAGAMVMVMTTHGVAAQPATIVGVVVDSLRGGPLGGAVVQVIDGPPLQTSADAAGRFRIDSVPPGAHRIAVFHPFLDTLGATVVSSPITFAPGAMVTAVFATPSPAALLHVMCPRDTVGGGTLPAGVIGEVVRATDARPVNGATVTLAWTVVEASTATGVARSTRVRDARTGTDGRFHVCAPPGVSDASLGASVNGARTGWVSLALAPGSVAVSALRLGDDSARAVAIGRVVGPRGEPIAGAIVTLPHTAARAETRDSGAFTLAELPAGTQALRVVSPGYAPRTLSVNLGPGVPWRGVITLEAAAPTLSTVRVTADRVAAGYAAVGFSERRERGAGTFLSLNDIARKRAQTTADLFDQVPGVYLDRTFNPPILVGSRGRTSLKGASGACVNLWVDRHRVVAPAVRDTLSGMQQAFTPMRIDEHVSLGEIAAIEVYSAAAVPTQFEVPGESCPVVVVWTRSAIGL